MTFDQLTYFIAIVEEDTFFDAAERVHITQSSLSKQIMHLEKELGVALLDRRKRKASLTLAGQAFYEEALTIVDQYEQMQKRMKDFRQAARGRLCVGTLPVLTQYDLTIRFQDYKKTHPGVELIIDEVEDKELEIGIKNGKYDLIICRENMLPKTGYTSVRLTEDELVVVRPQGVKGSLRVSDMAGEKFLLMNSYTSIYKTCMTLFKTYGIEPQIVRTARVESILSAVALGEGISLLPKGNFRIFHHEMVSFDPLDPPVEIPLIIAGDKRRMTSALYREFIHTFSQRNLPEMSRQ